MNERVVSALGAKIKRAAARYNQTEIFVAKAARDARRLKINALGVDARTEAFGEGAATTTARRRSFYVDENEWRRIVRFVGDDAISRSGFEIVEQDDKTRRVYMADVPQTQTRLGGAARMITATQVKGPN